MISLPFVAASVPNELSSGARRAYENAETDRIERESEQMAGHGPLYRPTGAQP